MRYALALLILIALPCRGQTAPQAAANASAARGLCSTAATTEGTFVIRCAVDRQRGAELVAILNKILANQLSTPAVMAQLDQMNSDAAKPGQAKAPDMAPDQTNGLSENPPARKPQPPRRLSDALKNELSACLKKSEGKFSVMAIANDSEAYVYARDWWEVFVSAGWQMQNRGDLIETFHIGGGDWSGMRVSMHEDSLVEKQAAEPSAEDNFARCVEGRYDIPAGGRILRYPERPSGSLSIQVSTQPQ